jgi:hypothetical protein
MSAMTGPRSDQIRRAARPRAARINSILSKKPAVNQQPAHEGAILRAKRPARKGT